MRRIASRSAERAAEGLALLCGIALAVATGCEHKPSPSPPSAKRDAAVVLDGFVADANNLKQRLAELPAPYPPPPPLKRNHARGDCRAEYAARPERDPVPMCLVKGDAFVLTDSSIRNDGTDGSATTKQTRVKDFYIDQFEVTIQQAVLFLNAHGNKCVGLDRTDQDPRSPYANECIRHGAFAGADRDAITLEGIIEHDGQFSVQPGYEFRPEGYFSLEGALRYCEWVGKNVPSVAQWEYAARHDPVSNKELIYPWGNRWVPAAQAGVGKPASIPTVGMFDGTDGHADRSSPWGVHDMSGGLELTFECSAPDETCQVGSSCSCQALALFGHDNDHATLATSDRFSLGLIGRQRVRCVRLAPVSRLP